MMPHSPPIVKSPPPDDNNKTPVLSWRCTTGMTLRPLCVATLAGTLQHP